jgi:N-acylglucosamine-6-phosphate 2-epimerase
MSGAGDAAPDVLAEIAGGLVVSVQAEAGTPLAAPAHMAALAAAAERGGAVAIRAEGADDVAAIGRAVGVPVIGLRKRRVEGSEVYITPELGDALAIAEAGAAAVAIDATDRPRPGGVGPADFVADAVAALAVPVIADVDSEVAGVAAHAAGAAAVATTLAGYTERTDVGASDTGVEAGASASGIAVESGAGLPGIEVEPIAVPSGPDVALVARLAATLDCPVLAEGRYATPGQVAAAFDAGAHAVVVGTAISDALALTRAFAAATPAGARADGGR